jgi:spermidine/putrescine transport system permease protein
VITLRRRALTLLQRRPDAAGAALVSPGLVWLLVFFFAPIVIMLAYSFMGRGVYGGVEHELTTEHYQRFADPLYLKILWRSVVQSLLCTVLCLLIGYPVAWVIASSGRYKHLLTFLVVLPLWTSVLVRTFAVIFLLRDSGLINSLLMWSGIIDEPIALLYTPFAVQIGLLYSYLPFMILPIYVSLEKMDPSLLEAAEVLGARPVSRFFQVILPLSMPGVIAGSLLVFIPALGAYLPGDLLGGAKHMMIGNLVQNQFTAARNWPFGSAVSFVMMAVVLIAVLGYLRTRERSGGGI